jgi:APA family basic amino acid/polyamine antiporter
MIIGTLVVTVIYLLTNLAYLFLLPAEQIRGSEDVAARAITSIFPEGGVIIAVIIAISCLGTAGIYTLSVPRIYFAMAKDGVFFKKLAVLHPTYKTPVYAIIMQSIWAIVLLLFWGTFADLITYILFTDWIFLTLAAISIFIFRVRVKKKSEFKTFGYPITPLVFIGLSLFLLANTLIEKPMHAIAGLSLLVCGIPVYYLFRSMNKKKQKP